jgi:hypothetical protein
MTANDSVERHCRPGLVRAHPGREGGRCVTHRQSGLYGAFVWACKALNSQKRRPPPPLPAGQCHSSKKG